VIVGLDTSVLVRLLTGEPRDLALAALGYLLDRKKAGDRVLVSDWVVAEAYYALQHHYGVSKKDTLSALRNLLASPEVEATGEVVAVLAIPGLESSKPGFIDRVIHRNYLSSGAEEVATFERAAAKLPRVRVLAPAPA
jgi:predicted nucleic-acid-binding protein